ncbi:hypothetical protein BJY01DRAFT_249391 [Aspergillus pseudoustus]|uniref:Uncharacterized protein n=1 Tax=Aspergillus pseudoustus TaxID=1810923 RepID=A0ABR4JPH8_9EURO
MPHSIEERVPSLRAAAALTTPSKLLRFSIVTLFVALGIYLGCVYHAGLGNLDGGNANLGVLLFFVVITTSVLCDAFLAMASMFAYQSSLPDEDVQGSGGSEAGNAAEVGNTLHAPSDIIKNALEPSIHAQKESLKAQKALLDLLSVQSAK